MRINGTVIGLGEGEGEGCVEDPDPVKEERIEDRGKMIERRRKKKRRRTS